MFQHNRASSVSSVSRKAYTTYKVAELFGNLEYVNNDNQLPKR